MAHGGTGVSTLTDGGVLLGNGTGAITAMAVLSDGQMIVGDGTTDPVAESGATLRTSIGCNPVAGSTSVTTLGTITTGVWNGTAIDLANHVTGVLPSANLDADTAHLTTTQTFTGNKTFTGTVTVGVDDTGKDVKFFGATSGKYMLWDESADELIIVGDFSATSKSFVITHPTKPGKTLRHGSLEGPEHGVYIRGKLVDGETIELPDYWIGLVDEDTLTVQLTPSGRFQRLYVDNISNSTVTIANEDDGPIDCFYFIQAERKDVDKLVVEY